jgi:hypothetical protein
MSFNVPPTCASCGAPQQTTRTTSKMNSYGRRRVTRSFQVPYCAACAAREQAFGSKGLVLGAVALVVALVLSALPLAIRALPAGVAVGVALVVAIVFGVVVKTVLAPRHPPPPATTAGRAVRLVKFDHATSTLHCTNAAWGQEFAQRNGVQAIPKSRGQGFGTGALLIAVFCAPLGSGIAWAVAHPSVHVDNGGPVALQIYVDGSPEIVVQPNTAGLEPPTLSVAYGRHTFGASRIGASKPETTVDADVTINDAHLYNPGKTACYWLVAASYGSASVAGISQGPQPIKEFYSFDNVNIWFADTPQSITVDNGQSGGTRVALQRAATCMQIAKAGCPFAVRDQFVNCQRAARDDAAFEACTAAAKAGCVGGGGAPTPASTAAAAHTPATHPTATAPAPTTTAKPAVKPTAAPPPRKK